MTGDSKPQMKIYLVGGAVRDALLHLPVHENDWLVVGATPEIMEAQGFRAVGKDFPVFLHPQTREEYALARTERKTAPGYRGFTFHAAADVTLEEDLQRRDLTINAIARDEHGALMDPCGGQRDIEQKILRHISPAFAEDPVRILRVARFAARYHHLGFRIAPDTLELMRTIVKHGEADALVAERIWQETLKALGEQSPDVFFSTLRDCGALATIFPELDALFGVPQSAHHHPEIDTGIHTLLVLQQCAKLTADTLARFAALCHDLGKALTPESVLPRHIGHEQKGLKPLNALCDRLAVPNEYRELALRTALYHTHCHRALELRASTIVELFEHLDLFRRPQRLEPFLLACEADARGRTGYENCDYPQAHLLRRAWEHCHTVDSTQIDPAHFKGKAFGEELRRLRVASVQAVAQPQKGNG